MDIVMMDDQIAPLNRLRCVNDTDLVGNPFEESSVIVFLMGDRSDNYTCYNRDELNQIITTEYAKKLFIKDEETGVSLETEPLFTEPHRGILIDNSMIAFQHENAFFIYERGQFTVDRERKQVYSLLPIALETVLTTDLRELKHRIKRAIPEMKEMLYRTKMSILAGGAIPQFIGRYYTNSVREEDRIINQTLTERHLPAVEGRYLPAVEESERTVLDNGTIVWLLNGVKHRDGGLPAVEWGNGTREWWVDGQLHRDDGLPAVELANGDKKWYVNGQLHRDNDLPAIEYANGDRVWWVNGNRHRDGDLPAVELTTGHKEWLVNGQLHRDGGLPAIEYANGDRAWYVNNQLHRDGGLPAVERADGTKLWLVNGRLHRDNGFPAIEYANGDRVWYVNGERI